MKCYNDSNILLEQILQFLQIFEIIALYDIKSIAHSRLRTYKINQRTLIYRCEGNLFGSKENLAN